MKLSERLTFTAEYPSGTFTALNPVFEDLEISKVRDGGDSDPYFRYVYRTEIESDLTFKGDDYTFLKNIEGTDPCAEVLLEIQCDGLTIFDGYLKLIGGEYNKYLCRAKIPTEIEDQYTCLYDSLKTKINILTATTKQTIFDSVGEFDIQTCTQQNVTFPYVVGAPFELDTCLTNPGDGWTVLNNTIDNIVFNTMTGEVTGDVTTRWIRERVISVSPPPGTGWTNIGGNTWVRSPFLVFDDENSIDWNPSTTADSWIVAYLLPANNIGSIDNGVLLEDVIQRMLQFVGCSSLNLVSNFFNFNPDSLNVPVNAPYAETKQHNIIVFQKSDVVRASAFSNATRGELTFEELFEWLYIQFKVLPRVEGNTLRLEHVSYYESPATTSIDLTLITYERWIKDKQNYRYRSQEVPRSLNFTWMDQDASSFIFTGFPITYSARCSEKDADGENLNLTRISNDLAAILNSNGNGFADDGFVFVNVFEFNGQWRMDFEISPIDGNAYLNGFLSFPNLQDNFWRHDSYLPQGTLNDSTIIFDSVRPLRELDAAFVPGFCCEDFINLDPSGVMLHPCSSNAQIEKVTFSLKKGGMTFEPVF